MKRIVLVVVFIFLAGFVGYYFYLTSQLSPDPLPSYVYEAEDALAFPGTVILGHLNFKHAVHVDRKINGSEDPFALLNPDARDGSITEILMQNGVDFRNAITQVLGAFIITEDGPSMIGIIFGNFPVDIISKALEKTYITEYKNIDGYPTIEVIAEDVKTCKPSAPIAVHITNNRIVLASPGIIGTVLDRINNNAPTDISLTEWKNFRQGKIFSIGLLVPQNANQFTNEPFTKHFVSSASEELESVQSAYAGASVQLFNPPGVKFEIDIHSTDQDWVKESIRSFNKIKKDFENEFATKLPTLSKLHHFASCEDKGKTLQFNVTFNKELMQDIAQIPMEILSLMFSGFGAKTAQTNQQVPTEEKIVRLEDITTFANNFSHSRLTDFDMDTQNFNPDIETGPFGIRIKSARLFKDDKTVVELEFEVESNHIKNISKETMHEMKGDALVQLFITQILDSHGNQLLREEHCGKDRNSFGTPLKKSKTNIKINGNYQWISILKGRKSVRLKSGINIVDISNIVGYVDLNLPVEVEEELLELPFKGKTVETPDVRMLFKESNSNEIKYAISGQPSHVLAVRALNRNKEYLQSSGTFGMKSFGGSGQSITKEFRGEIAFVEVVVAHQLDRKQYPFSLSSTGPQFDTWDFPKPYKVLSTTKEQFLALPTNDYFNNFCKKGEISTFFKSLLLCTESLKSEWNGVQGRFRIIAPDSPALRRNLSGIEIIIEEGKIKGKDNEPDQSLLLSECAFVNLYQKNFWEEHSDKKRDISYLVNNTLYVGGLKGHEEFKGKEIIGAKGRLVVRLPTELSGITLNVTQLGNETIAPNGLHVRFVEISDGKLYLSITGPRDRIVQFVPMDHNNIQLATNAEQISPSKDEEGKWMASLNVSGKPQYLHIMYTEKQDVIEYPFVLQLDVKDQ